MGPKLRKLVAMSPREIGFRVGRSMALSWERIRYRSGFFDWSTDAWRARLCRHMDDRPKSGELPGWWQQHMLARNEPAALLATADMEDACARFRTLFADRINPIVDAAEDVCRGTFSFLGIRTVQPDRIDWHVDPKSGYHWESAFHHDVDFSFCRVGGGDVKYVWELSRQEYLIDCAKAYRLAGEPRFARRISSIVGSWIESNRYLDGVHWASALEVAVRSLTWLWSYQFCRPLDQISPQEHLAWIKSFYHHGAYLHRHLSYYFSPNNHLIGEATALYLLGCFFPEFDESPAWRNHGWSVLAEHYRHQYYPDGGSTEQATFYHNYCLGFLLLAVLTRQRRGEPVPDEMLGYIERALEFTMWMTRPDGTVPRIGDADNARSIRFENPEPWDFRNLLCLGAVMFCREDLKAAAGGFSEDALWLLGVEGFQQFEKLGADFPRDTSRAFPDSGYYIMRSGWGTADHHLAFDCGPIAGGLHTSDVPSSAHGHSDLLSFSLTAFGHPLLVDGGFYTYDEDADWHRYFREASAHNTILLDGASHAKFHASNAWSSIAIPESMRWKSTSLFEYVESAHSGFFGVAPPVRHGRAIFWNRVDQWLILDRLDGEGTHKVEVFFHFAPGQVRLIRGQRGVLIRTDKGVHASLYLLESNSLDVELIHGGDGPDGGWIGTSYGHRARAPVVRFFGTVALPLALSFALQPSEHPLDVSSVTCEASGRTMAR